MLRLQPDPYTEVLPGGAGRRIRGDKVLGAAEYAQLVGERAIVRVSCQLNDCPSSFGPAVEVLSRADGGQVFRLQDKAGLSATGPLDDLFSGALVSSIELLLDKHHLVGMVLKPLDAYNDHGHRFGLELQFGSPSLMLLTRAIAMDAGQRFHVHLSKLSDPNGSTWGRLRLVQACREIQIGLARVLEAAAIPDDSTLLKSRHISDILGRRYSLDEHMRHLCEVRSWGLKDADLQEALREARLGTLKEFVDGKRVKLLDHQLAQARHMCDLERDDSLRGGILAEEMRLGKTVTFLVLLCIMKHRREVAAASSGEVMRYPKLRPHDTIRPDHLRILDLCEWEDEQRDPFPQDFLMGDRVESFAPGTTLYITTHLLVQQVREEAERWTSLEVMVLAKDDLRCKDEAQHRALLARLARHDLVIMSFEVLQAASSGETLPWRPDVDDMEVGDHIIGNYEGRHMEGELVSRQGTQDWKGSGGIAATTSAPAGR
jgi:hypothetical protein